MHTLAGTLQRGESDHAGFKVQDDILHFPVNMPRLEGVVAPGLQRVARVNVHTDDTIRANADHFLEKKNQKYCNIYMLLFIWLFNTTYVSI